MYILFMQVHIITTYHQTNTIIDYEYTFDVSYCPLLFKNSLFI